MYEEDGDGAMNWTQACMHLASRLGINARHKHNEYGAIKAASISNKEQIESNEGWNPQDPGQLTRWPSRHMIACLSYDGHLTEHSALILCDVGMHHSCYNWGSYHNL